MAEELFFLLKKMADIAKPLSLEKKWSIFEFLPSL
jgi:hypothetical protein